MQYPSLLREHSIISQVLGASVAGFDEVGRGCIAGPVVAAVVLITEDSPFIHGVMDSKKISEKHRTELSELLMKSYSFGIGEASSEEIDSIGIIRATRTAMLRAYWQLPIRPDYLVVDGEKTTFPLLERSFHYVRGDQRLYSIAAASIIAKVFRDSSMSVLAHTYPGYGFDQHKGYGTAFHYSAIQRLGLSPIHRKSFLKNFHSFGLE